MSPLRERVSCNSSNGKTDISRALWIKKIISCLSIVESEQKYGNNSNRYWYFVER
jgi:hypothetical protein